MKNHAKKLILVIAAAIMMTLTFCMNVSAYESYDIFEYSVNSGEVTIEKCDEAATGMIVIPDKINGYPVTRIGSFAFDECDAMTGVVIPESVEYIEEYAFDECSGLKNIIINAKVWLNEEAFWYCFSTQTIYISKNVKGADYDAFYYGSSGPREAITVYYEGSQNQWESGDFNIKYKNIVYNHSHSYKKETVKASTSVDGYSKNICDCGLENGQTIAKIASISLSKTSYTANGKAKTPSVVVKDSNGKTLTKDKDYTVAYAKSRTNPGAYTVKVTFKGNYTGSKKLTFKIYPGKTSKISTSVGTSSVTLKWNKVLGATGYRVYIYDSSTKDYKKLKTTTGTSYKATGLTDNKTYKFKILAYSDVDGTIFWAKSYSTIKATTKKAVKVALSSESLNLCVGSSKTLKATTYPENVTVKWKSGDTSVAKVSSKGKVTAISKGTAKITAYFKYKNKTYKATCVVKVKNPSITLSKTSATVYVYDSLKLTAKTFPTDVTVKWKSSNNSVLKVSSSGKVVPVSAGTAKVTAYFTYKNKTYKKSCTVTVKYKAPITVEYVDWNVNSVGGVEPSVEITNNTGKDIKYIDIYTEYKNKFGDPAYCEISNNYTRTLCVESGLAANSTKTFYWDPAVYNSSVHRIDINYAEITFVDNTTATVEIYRYWYDSYYYYQ